MISWKSVKESQLKVKKFSVEMLEKLSEYRKRVLKNTGKIYKNCWRVIRWTEIIIIIVELLLIFR